MSSVTIGSNTDTFAFDIAITGPAEATAHSAAHLAERITSLGFSQAAPDVEAGEHCTIVRFVLAMEHRQNLAQARARIERIVMMEFRTA